MLYLNHILNHICIIETYSFENVQVLGQLHQLAMELGGTHANVAESGGDRVDLHLLHGGFARVVERSLLVRMVQHVVAAQNGESDRLVVAFGERLLVDAAQRGYEVIDVHERGEVGVEYAGRVSDAMHEIVDARLQLDHLIEVVTLDRRRKYGESIHSTNAHTYKHVMLQQTRERERERIITVSG